MRVRTKVCKNCLKRIPPFIDFCSYECFQKYKMRRERNREEYYLRYREEMKQLCTLEQYLKRLQ